MGLKHLIEWATKEQVRQIMLKPHERPVCPECGKPMRLEYFERPSGNLGNRYVSDCDCIRKDGGQRDA